MLLRPLLPGSSIFGHANYKDPTRIFVEHLQRVNDICLRMGLKPMIWSDSESSAFCARPIPSLWGHSELHSLTLKHIFCLLPPAPLVLFCLNARNNSLLGYYDSAKPSSVSVEGIPANMELVYWDYYHTSEASYASRIENHWDLGRKSPWMAAGSWTWSRFWTALPFTFATCRASQNASKSLNSGVK